MRDYTKNHYAAFWYCRGLEYAQAEYEEIVEWAKGAFLELPDIIIKRGCTEFEIQGTAGDSFYWGIGPQQDYIETWLDDRLDFDPFINIGQTEDIRQKIRLRWMRWAYCHGDETYIPDNGHEPLYRNCRVYHEETITTD